MSRIQLVFPEISMEVPAMELKKEGFDEIRLVCKRSNIPSGKMIQKCGGQTGPYFRRKYERRIFSDTVSRRRCSVCKLGHIERIVRFQMIDT